MNCEKIVQNQLDFYNAHDLEGFISTYADDITIYSMIDNTVILKGKEELKEKYYERFKVLKVHAELVNRIVIGNKIIDHEYVTGLKRDEIVKAVAVYEIEDSLIKRVWFIFE